MLSVSLRLKTNPLISLNSIVKFLVSGIGTITTFAVSADNFAEQVQILDNADTTDLFDYKYITFDDSAVFEIKDCIKNLKYTTLFIQYLSNITFDTADSNFMIDGISVSTLQKLGFDVNKFAEILNSSLKISNLDYNTADFASQEDFLYAIKLRFSQYPENLNHRYTAGQRVEKNNGRRLIY